MSTRSHVSHIMLRRACSEFLEMPGLHLTCQQAQRLWGLDAATCLALLECLVDEKFLYRTGRGMYARLTEGHSERLPRSPAMGVDSVRRRIDETV